ncbi:hypothetical protein JL09_g7092 [Pichia kudriavzevii]|uniref:Uncharacterized protein n=1 Tax=Pichia kudriavzevii TaxID=4909 RepID=A0A099NK20_PICKU|nr:hypothetical protein JL09_g7092 [Pichia kudriavzevii]
MTDHKKWLDGWTFYHNLILIFVAYRERTILPLMLYLDTHITTKTT